MPVHFRRIIVGAFKDSTRSSGVTEIAKVIKQLLVTDRSVPGQFEVRRESAGRLLFHLLPSVKLLIS